MDILTLILVGLAVGLVLFAFIKGKNLAKDGITLTIKTIWTNLPLMLAGFIIAGFMQVLFPKELISRWLGTEAGIKAVFIGCFAGGIIPGSPYVVFPVVAGLYKAGAGMGSIVGFVSAWSLWSVSRLPLEMGLIDPKLALIRYGITFIVPPAAGLLANTLVRYLL